MARKIDQLEIGTGFLYSSRIESSSGSSGAFAEMPMLVQWMFRMPPRGSLMAGPRVGGTLIQDSVDTSKGNFAFTWGASLRFFPYDELGFFLDLAVVHRTSLFLTRQAGISFRF
ncbi:MAG: hypothetical protein JST16_11910 [Bdellovibrionales bacterium]|nr:hypothetical protein [Bdellovibrionales bacterium]